MKSTEKRKRRPKGDGSVQQLSKGKFKIQITIGYDQNGKQLRKSFTGKSQREVLDILNQFKAEQQRGTLVAPSSCTLSEFGVRWLNCKKLTAKKKTFASYEFACRKHIMPFLGTYKLQKITTAHINSYFSSKVSEGLSPATLSQHRAILHNIFKLAVAEGMLGKNAVSAAATIPKAHKEQGILSDDEMTRLLAVAKDYARKPGNNFIYCIILLALATGMRRGELLALSWENVNLLDNSIRITSNLVEIAGRQVLDTPKTNGSRRIISVDPEIIKILKRELWSQEGGLVFKKKDGGYIPFSNLGRTFKKMLKYAGIGKTVRIHDLRHTHVTHLLSNGYDLKMVAGRIGDDIRTAMQIYAHALPEKDKDAASFIGSKLLK